MALLAAAKAKYPNMVLDESEKTLALQAAADTNTSGDIGSLTPTQREAALQEALNNKLINQLSLQEKNTILANAASDLNKSITVSTSLVSEADQNRALLDAVKAKHPELSTPAKITADDARTAIAGTAHDGTGGLLATEGTALNKAANIADLQAVAQAGTTFVGDSGDVHRPIGTALNIKGGATGDLSNGNIGVVSNGTDTLEIKLAKDIQGINSITLNPGSNGQSVTIDQNGLDNGGNRIRNVAPGVESSDAATVGQLKDVEGRLSNRIDGVAATAAAMASLPQAYIPGKSMVAVSSGVHRSQQAVAIGVSRISDNGKVILKLNAGHNTNGDTSFGAGVGIQF